MHRAAIAIATRNAAFWYRFPMSEVTYADACYPEYAHLASDVPTDGIAEEASEVRSAIWELRSACAASATRGGP